ncbi:MAG: universal stress protein UspA [Alteromonadaceae bacterium]|uniref:universal stress protein n=1 Tax=unclassified Marinobacter TaxID=83889 RepID=UPI000C350F67|nr:universal stress protein [Marinobacter sp. BGYM27]MAA63917.1 universal stress protein UspA [Alteromonadaceae bacterium]MBH85690.1 universal stress protein UspA [Alteromonadaceae bacterium]MDG5500419.1 universal stress protein [Marinobacter sp. BGYM27]|tara:strand:+ start:456 stop:899 length:444 start_codon:yes stop_codon:yes gene_type:complete
MALYNIMLAAIDLTDEADQVIQRAQELRAMHEADLILLHVVEPVGYAYGGDIPMDLTELQDQLDSAAKEQLAVFGRKFDIPPENLVVAVGRPEAEIHRVCDERDVDLAIIGSHGRHGIQLLLGSTANGVLHGAKRDVLAVRINTDDN